MKTHELKLVREWWDDVEQGRMTFNIRVNDRDYQVGDYIVFVRYENDGLTVADSPPKAMYKEITFLMPGGAYGLDDKSVALQLGEPVLNKDDILSRMRIVNPVHAAGFKVFIRHRAGTYDCTIVKENSKQFMTFVSATIGNAMALCVKHIADSEHGAHMVMMSIGTMSPPTSVLVDNPGEEHASN